MGWWVGSGTTIRLNLKTLNPYYLPLTHAITCQPTGHALAWENEKAALNEARVQCPEKGLGLRV